MKLSAIASKAAISAAFLCISTSSYASFVEHFDTPGALPDGWITKNLSTRNSTGNPWSVADGIQDEFGDIVVSPHAGDGMALVNYTSIGSGTGTINNWLISPLITGLRNGDTFSFYTTTVPNSEYPDRLEFRMSTGSGTDVGTTTTGVGSFTSALLSVNSSVSPGGYPEDWTKYTVTLSGLSAPIDGRVAFRYFVPNGGPSGDNSNIIGLDDFSYISAVPEPGSVTMLLAGVGVLAGLQRRRRNAGRAA
ncbi:choice-of-anchor J domain-containing protein [Rugamonas sp. A1-17]|nr:choice-of-anchor J domain-containing protein [Rugamonas sp. A1-17]